MAAEAGNVGGCGVEINDREGEFWPRITRIPRIVDDRRAAFSVSDIGEIRG
jgi:hypothetical protein